MPINSLLYPSNVFVPTAYNVDNSCRFNDGSSDHMFKTASAGNRRTFTFSTWFKRGQLSTNQQFFTSYSAANAGGFAYMQLEAPESGVIGDRISLEVYGTILLKTNQVLRDPSSWYNLVIAVDTTSGTANNRCRMYLNGTEITSFATRNNPDQNFDFAYNQNSVDLVLGSNNYGGNKGNYFDGYLAETVWIDGTQYAASDFGEFDDSGIWKPIDVSGLTFGTNGFYLDYEASNNLGNDANGGTDLTEANLTAIDQSTDTCTNNFATINPLNVNPANTNTFSEGNLKAVLNGEGTTSTMAMASGNWYMEYKCSGNITQWTGVEEINSLISLQYSSATKSVALYVGGATMYVNGANQGSGGYGSGWSSGDIGMIAFDADNARVYFGKNGGWWNGSSYGASSPSTYVTATTGKTYYFRFVKGGNTTCDYEVNFGGTQSFAISSGNTDGNGYGNFEYAVPSGYYALNTKNLAEYG